MVLSLGFSPCPNDTYIFWALMHGKLHHPDLAFQETIADVETLNQMVLSRKPDISKVSYHAFGLVRDDYRLLRSGGALGKGCGPLLVCRGNAPKPLDLLAQRIAIPGELTTAYLLLRLYEPKVRNITVMPFYAILKAVNEGLVEAGLIIHESRFTYQQFGLRQIIDLGEWWEATTGYPIPLGGIIMKRSLGQNQAQRVEELIRQSILMAGRSPHEAWPFLREHAQEMEDSVIKQHLDLYVNDYSLDLGSRGEEAVRVLLTKAEEAGIMAKSYVDLF